MAVKLRPDLVTPENRLALRVLSHDTDDEVDAVEEARYKPYLLEEMLAFGVDPDTVTVSAYLSARAKFLRGECTLADVPRVAQEASARERAIADAIVGMFQRTAD